MGLFKNGVLAALILFNFVVTIVSALIIYEAVTLENPPGEDKVDRIKTYGYILLASIVLNFVAWVANVVKESKN